MRSQRCYQCAAVVQRTVVRHWRADENQPANQMPLLPTIHPTSFIDLPLWSVGRPDDLVSDALRAAGDAAELQILRRQKMFLTLNSADQG